MRWTRTSALVLTAGLSVTAAACGSSTPSSTPPAGHTTTTTAATTTSTLPPVSMPTAAGTFGTAPPTVTVPTGAPPTALEASDLITGTGATAAKGDTAEVQYVLVDYSTGKVIQSSWTDNMPFSFTLDATPEQVITGWDEGVTGMKVGGRRELVIPPNLAYGSDPPPNSGIASGATLIFIVDLLKVS